MADFKFALLLILCLDAVLFLGNAAMLEANPSMESFYGCSGTTLGEYGNCANYTVSQTPKDALPGGTPSVDPTTGTAYTDVFTSLISWLFEIPGAGLVLRILGGPLTILHSVPSIPGIFTFTIGVVWYSFTFFLLISFFLGRQGEG